MIFIDTNVFIDLIKIGKGKEIFANNKIAICGVVVAEILHGAKNEKHAKILMNAITDFKIYEIESSDWKNIGLLLMKLRQNGISVPLSDAVIAFIAAKNETPLWTYDKHFLLIKNHLPKLQLFREE